MWPEWECQYVLWRCTGLQLKVSDVTTSSHDPVPPMLYVEPLSRIRAATSHEWLATATSGAITTTVETGIRRPQTPPHHCPNVHQDLLLIPASQQHHITYVKDQRRQVLSSDRPIRALSVLN